LVTAGILYVALERSLDIRDHALLASKVQVFRALLKQEARHRDVLASEVEHESTGGGMRYYVRILDREGRLVIETPSMARLLPPSVFRSPPHVSTDSLDEIANYVHKREPYLLLTVEAPVGVEGNGDVRIVQAALDASPDLRLLTDYRRTLTIVLVLGLGFAVVAAGWLTRRSTQPLIEIARRTSEVTANRLGERIVVSGWPAELVQVAVALNAMLDRLEDSFTRLSHFSGDLAHALRTPLGNLRGETEVALAQNRTQEEYKRVLASSIEEYERLSRMVDSLLFIARSDDPRALVERKPFDARKEIEDVQEFHQAIAAEQGVEVCSEGQASICGDRMLFRRAVTNLVGNALQHTPAGGSVRIALRAAGDGSVQVSVSDTGLGIEPEHLPKIFDRFFRTERARASVPGGSGLGLAIVRSIMRLHGGSVVARSELGQGTTVALLFPASAGPAADANMTKL